MMTYKVSQLYDKVEYCVDDVSFEYENSYYRSSIIQMSASTRKRRDLACPELQR